MDIDLTEIVDVAAQAVYEDRNGADAQPWAELSRLEPAVAYVYRSAVLPVIDAAAPLIGIAVLNAMAAQFRGERMNLPASLLEAEARKIEEHLQ